QSLHLLNVGETRRAGQLVSRSLELCVANDLCLRQVACLILLARIYEKRDMHRPAQVLLARADALADDADYANGRESVARMFSAPRSGPSARLTWAAPAARGPPLVRSAPPPCRRSRRRA